MVRWSQIFFYFITIIPIIIYYRNLYLFHPENKYQNYSILRVFLFFGSIVLDLNVFAQDRHYNLICHFQFSLSKVLNWFVFVKGWTQREDRRVKSYLFSYYHQWLVGFLHLTQYKFYWIFNPIVEKFFLRKT